MLAGAGLSNHAGFTHALSQQGLAQNLVTLVSAAVHQVFTLKQDACAAA